MLYNCLWRIPEINLVTTTISGWSCKANSLFSGIINMPAEPKLFSFSKIE